jgi:hypothetical protein
MRRWLWFPILLFLFGCGLKPSAISGRSATRNGSPPADTLQAATPLELSSGPFTLTIFSPADQALVTEPQVEIRAELSAEAVVSIDEDTYVFEAGTFSQTVPLEEGLNSVQIVASDMDGNEVDLILTITFQP